MNEFITELVKKTIEHLTAFDSFLVLLLLGSLFLAYRLASIAWDSLQKQHTDLTSRLDKLEKQHQEDTKAIGESIERQTEVSRKNAELFNNMSLDLVRIVTVLNERKDRLN